MLETIWNLILPHILELTMTIISLVVARYVIPAIKNDLVPWLEEKRLHNIVKDFVQAAEKMSESGMISKVDKKTKVIELLTDKGIKINTTVEMLIESCVKELDMLSSVVYEEIIETEKEEN